MKNALFAAIIAGFVMSSVSFADDMKKTDTTDSAPAATETTSKMKTKHTDAATGDTTETTHKMSKKHGDKKDAMKKDDAATPATDATTNH